METTDLAAQVRKEHKKGPARRLRQQGFVPAATEKSLAEYGEGAVYMRLPLAEPG